MYNKNNQNKPWSPRPVETKSTYSGSKNTIGKKKDFMSSLNNTIEDVYNNVSITENGAVGFKTTGKKLLDLNFAVASLRNASDMDIAKRFREAFNEDPITAIRWLFYVRDAREGVGERRLFRICMSDMAKHNMNALVNALIPVMPEYGRFDDLWELLDIKSCRPVITKYVGHQLSKDSNDMQEGKSISLLAKWMPSENASSEKTKHYAHALQVGLGYSPKLYRKTLSKLRAYIDVVERKMSAKEWEAIDYEAVPSKANLIYNSAFLKNDTERRRCYLEALTKGEAKINSSVLFPHEIVHKYCSANGWYSSLKSKADATLEGLWKSLPDLVQGCGNTIVVADGSGSMCSPIDRKGGTTALEVANALAIYFAERSSGQFKDKYITFSSRPQFVSLSSDTLRGKLQEALKHDECANTNVEAVFDLILQTAVRSHMSQEDIPANILIISDMEFDSCAESNSGRSSYRTRGLSANLFESIKKKYAQAGYQLPRLVFWNVASRTGTIPVKENDLGVALISGFSTNLVKMVMSNKVDPYEALLEAVNASRYDAVGEIATKVFR